MKSPMLILACALLVTTCSMQAARSDVPEAVVDAMNAAMTAAGLEAFSAEELQWLDFTVREYPKRLALPFTFEEGARLVEKTPDKRFAWKDANGEQEAQAMGDGLLVIASVYETPRGPELLVSGTVYGPNAEDLNAALGLADVFNAGWSGGAFKGSAIDIAVYCTRQFETSAEGREADLTAALSSWLEHVRSIRAALAEVPDFSVFHPARPEPEVIVRREVVEREVRVPVPVQAPTAAAPTGSQLDQFKARWARVERGMTLQQVFALVGRGTQTQASEWSQTYEWEVPSDRPTNPSVTIRDGVVNSKWTPWW